MRRALLALTSLLLAGSVLAACSRDSDGGGGSGGGIAPDTYMAGLCSAMADYSSDLTAKSSAFGEEVLSGSASPRETKTSAIAFVDELAAATEDLIDDVQALGTPDVGNGEDVRTTLIGAFEQVITLLDEAKADIEALDTGDPVAMMQGFGEVVARLQEARAEIQRSLSGFESPELDEAAEGVEACGAVR